MRTRSIFSAGHRFGRLTLLEPTRRSADKVLCRCDCGGKDKRILVGHLKSGAIKSCGCYALESRTKHGFNTGFRQAPEYACWHSIRQRCTNPKSASYASYGGRGITLCPRWATFEAFLADMGLRPSPDHSIDRINNELGYSPENCRWATPREQSRNRRSNNIITIDGVSKTVTDWAKEYGLNPVTVFGRIHRAGMNPLQALTTPLNIRASNISQRRSL